MTESFADAPTLWDLVERRAAATPDLVLLIDQAGNTLTCAEFRDRAERAAAGFAALGVTHGTRVTWELPNRFETVIASFALARLGAIQNPILHFYRHKEVGYAIRATDAELVLVPGEWNGFDFAAMVDELIADLPHKPQVVDVFAALPDGDPATLTEALAALRANRDERVRLRQLGREAVLTRHTWQALVQRVLAHGESARAA